MSFNLLNHQPDCAMNLATAFVASAEKNLHRPAVFWGDEELRYGDLLAQSQYLARLLRDGFDMHPGDRVAVWLKNCPQFPSVLFGIWQAGGVVVMINHFLKPDEINYILQDSGAEVVVSESSFGEAQAILAAGMPQLRFLLIEEVSRSAPDASFAPTRRAGSDLAALLYTSGTTGRPKGAMLTHANFLHNVNSCLRCLEVDANDRFVVLLPQFHSFMFTVGTLLPMLCGAGIILLKSLHPLRSVLEEVVRHRGTILPAVPQFFRTLAQLPASMMLPLRLCVSGGAPLPIEVLGEFNARFPVPLVEGYGPTESSPVATVNPIHGPWKAGSVGVPIPDVELSIRNDEGEDLPVDLTGEICIRGGNVMLGYWNQPEETAKVLRDGWLYTGDVGHRDADGYYYITDRKKDMLLVNGINVYPREVEEVLYQFPGVKEAAVIGLPDPRKGEQPVAFITPNDGVVLDEKAILQFVRGKLADYKVPRHVTFLPVLPRNATGKILKTALRQLPRPAVN
jgi:long-chain acyl-CoA synthetase